MEKDEGLSQRLNGIVDSATTDIATDLARLLRERMTPASLDVLRARIELAVRAATLEGARCAHTASFTLIEGRLTNPGFLKRTRVVNKPKSGLPSGV